MPSTLTHWVDPLNEGVAILKPVVDADTLATTFECQYVNSVLAELLGKTTGQLQE